MSFIAKMRNQSGLLMGILISVFLLTFIFGSGSIKIFSFISQNNSDRIGSVFGKNISRYEYNVQLENLRSKIKIKTDDKTVQDIVWSKIILENALSKEYEDLNIVIGDAEAVDIIQGNNIRSEVKATFINKDTKVFDKNMLIFYLQNFSKMSNENKFAWHVFEKSVIESRKKEKFVNLVRQSICFTNSEIQYHYALNSKEVVISYLYIPYSIVTDENIVISDADIKKYIEKNKESFQIEECVKAKYIAFKIDPTEDDINKLNLEVQALCNAFANTADDIAFAKVNTDGDVDSIILKFDNDNIPTYLKSRPLIKGSVIGPIHYASGYKICKIIDQITENGKSNYTMIVVEKKPVASEEAKNLAYSYATKCATTCKKSSDLDTFASDNGFYVEECILNKNDVMLSGKHKSRHTIKWLYENKVDKVSNIFEAGDYYIVAMSTNKLKKGTAPLDIVRDEVAFKLKNQQKGEIVSKSLNEIEINSLQNLNNQLENRGIVVERQRIKFSDNVLPQTINSKKAIGASFGLSQGRKKIVLDDLGVFVIEIVEVSENSNEYTPDFKQTVLKNRLNKNIYASFSAIEELANVVDERYKYF